MSEPTQVLAVRLPAAYAKRVRTEAKRRGVTIARVLTEGVDLYDERHHLPPLRPMDGQQSLDVDCSGAVLDSIAGRPCSLAAGHRGACE